MKKLITCAMTLALLAALTSASASNAGSAADPLITREYMDGVYAGSVVDSLTRRINLSLQTVFDKAAAPYGAGSSSLSVTQGLAGFVLPAGSAVTVHAGGGLIMTDGAMTVDVTSGEVIDVTTGLTAGGDIEKNHRYICTEDTVAVYTASQPAAFSLDGAYTPGEGMYAQFRLYDDVVGNEWFVDAAQYARDVGLFHGSETVFRDSADVSRAEMVYAIWMAAGAPEPGEYPEYSDLTESWYVDAVAWATQMEITNGVGDGKFNPDGGLDRQQMSTMLFRYVQSTGGDVSARTELSVFVDSDSISDWASEAVSWAVANGVIQGTDASVARMSPNMAATRSQVATVLMRMVPRA